MLRTVPIRVVTTISSSVIAAPRAIPAALRWSRILRQGHKVDRLMKRTIRSEDTQTVYGRVQGQGGA